MIYVKIGESSNSPNPLDLSANDFGSLETSTSSASGIHVSCHQIFWSWTLNLETDAGRVNILLYQELYKPNEH